MSKPNSYLLQYWKLFVNIANTELSKEQKVLLNQECKALTQAKNYTSQIRNNTRSSHADFMDVNTKKMAEYQKYNKAHKELSKITSEKSAPFTEILFYRKSSIRL